MPVATLRSVVLDCPDPMSLATFYAGILGGSPRLSEDSEEGDSWVVLSGHDGTRLAFQEVAGYVAPRWPEEEGGQQFHLDLTVDDLDRGEERVLALGAKLLDAGGPGRDFRVYADPVGHPFCLCVD
ncbi:VOC family protein [Streptomyces sp. NPDC001744]|uniref:VOC family protein n=1 Tax=Streptomyces sp. NPDC001744 TaxID=3364606 RepID=UPI0036BC6DED